ncbi:MAG: hypothetical protein LC791_07080 [Acidobacteria bacterium]|nr:hypothetical protein [Acidobacteriota bacterium]
MTTYTILDHPLTNDDQDALLMVTTVATGANSKAFELFYAVASAKWRIYTLDGSAQTAGVSYNVLVIKQ